MISAHSNNVSCSEIVAYLDDLVLAISHKRNFFEIMGSVEWRAKKLFDGNQEAFLDAMNVWASSSDEFKKSASEHLIKKLKADTHK